MKFKENQTEQKLRGGYYTPQNLADYVASWVLENNPTDIIEPSCGDGVFFQALANSKADKSINIHGFELFKTEATKANHKCDALGFKNAIIQEGDFLEWAIKSLSSKDAKYDGVIGNPPFIRYQFLEKSFQENTENIFKHLNLKFTKHTNAWVPFILSCIELLNDGGRLGMVIPSEIIHVMHAQSLRTYLGDTCSKIVIIDPKEIWFENTLQGAVILFAEKKIDKKKETKGVGIKSVQGVEFLNTPPHKLFTKTPSINGKTVIGKWTKAFLSKEENSLINKITRNKEIYKFDSIADVDVGIVTGANNFFLVDQDTMKKFDLEKYAHPMFGKSAHCKGIIYDKKQHRENQKNGYPSYFIYLDKEFDELPSSVQKYISSGEDELLHTRYKCRIRSPWYKVPSVYSKEVGMLKRAHETPRLIHNSMGAYTTDTAYRINSKTVSAEKLVYCFLNPLTAIYTELEGRYYGGGVLELVPSEIEKLYVPIPEVIDFNLRDLNNKMCKLSVNDILLEQGYKTLGAVGISNSDIESLHTIWNSLKKRRHRA